MKARELREKTPDELNQELLELLREHFKLRMQKADEQLKQHTQLKSVRHQIARVKTVLKEKGKQA